MLPPPAPDGALGAPGAPGGASGGLAGGLAGVGWQRVLVGNWAGAALTAGATLAATGLLAGLLALLAKPEDFGIGNTLTLATLLAAGAFGADLRTETESDGMEFTGWLGMFPLTVTLLALVTAVLVFRRVVRDYPALLPALGDAVRAALLLALGLLVPTLLFRSDNEELGRGWGADLSSDALDVEAELRASSSGAFFLGFLIVLTVLVIAVLAQRRWWTGRAGVVHDWLAAPLRGVVTVVLLLPAAGFLGLVAMVLLGEDTISEADPTDDTSAIVAAVIALVTSGGVWMLGLGSGAAIGAHGRATGEPSESRWEHLWGAVTDDEPGLWIAPLVLLAVLTVAALTVARRAPRRELVLGNLLVWAASLLLVVPLLVRLSGVRGGLTYEGGADSELGALVPDEFEATGYAGLAGTQSTLLITLVGVLVALVVAWRRGALDVGELGDRVRRVSGSLQDNPGRRTSPQPAPGATPPPGYHPGAAPGQAPGAAPGAAPGEGPGPAPGPGVTWPAPGPAVWPPPGQAGSPGAPPPPTQWPPPQP